MENESGIYPVDLKVLVRPVTLEEVTEGGIVIPADSRGREDMASIKATLTAIGPQAFEAIKTPAYRPKVGSKVLIQKYGGYLVKGKDGKDYRLLNDDDIVAVLDGDWDVRAA